MPLLAGNPDETQWNLGNKGASESWILLRCIQATLLLGGTGLLHRERAVRTTAHLLTR